MRLSSVFDVPLASLSFMSYFCFIRHIDYIIFVSLAAVESMIEDLRSENSQLREKMYVLR